MPRNVLFGGLPPEVLFYLQARRIEVTQSHRDLAGEEHTHAFTAAGVQDKRVLKDLLDALVDAVEDGTPFETFRDGPTGLRRWLEQSPVLTAARLKLIFDNQLKQANAAAQWQQIQAEKEDLPFLQYKIGPSKVHRDHHVALNGLVFRVDSEIASKCYPPNGHNCRCFVIQISESRARKLGYNFDDEPTLDSIIETEFKGTKYYTRVGDVPDQGWAYNPGEELARKQALERADEDAQEAVDEAVEKLQTATKRKRPIKLPEPEPEPEAWTPPKSLTGVELNPIQLFELEAASRPVEGSTGDRWQDMRALWSDLEKAIEELDGLEVRAAARRMVRQFYGEQVFSSDVVYDRPNRNDVHFGLLDGGVLGTHHTKTGEMQLTTKYAANELVSVVLHEELHGHTNLGNRFDLLNAAFDEVVVESLAQSISFFVTGSVAHSGYADMIDAVKRTIGERLPELTEPEYAAAISRAELGRQLDKETTGRDRIRNLGLALGISGDLEAFVRDMETTIKATRSYEWLLKFFGEGS